MCTIIIIKRYAIIVVLFLVLRLYAGTREAFILYKFHCLVTSVSSPQSQSNAPIAEISTCHLGYIGLPGAGGKVKVRIKACVHIPHEKDLRNSVVLRLQQIVSGCILPPPLPPQCVVCVCVFVGRGAFVV